MKLFARARGSKVFRYGWKVSLLALIAGSGLALMVFYGAWAQTYDMKKVGEMPERNTVFDVDGKIYSRLAGANRLKVSLDEVSPFFVAALLAREDTRFYQHKGIDWRGILRALVRDVLSGSAKEGASSITQQLARNSLPLGGRTLNRKILEAMVALRIEQKFTKQQILELYMNRIYFGSGCYGVETASQAYFGKSASKLNLSEAALLAGLIRSPNRFSPLKNPEGAAIQRNAVLDRMVELKKVSGAEAGQAKLTKVNARPKRMLQIQENYAMDAVQRDLNLLLTQDQIDNGGLFMVYKTLPSNRLKRSYQELSGNRTSIIPSSRVISRPKTARTPPCRIWRAPLSPSITRAVAFARWLAAAIMRRASLIAPWRPLTDKSGLLLNLLYIHLLSARDSCPGPPLTTGRFSRAKSTAQEIGLPETLMALTAATNRVPMA